MDPVDKIYFQLISVLKNTYESFIKLLRVVEGD